MKKITKKELFELVNERLRENEKIYAEETHNIIMLNGITIYYTYYNAYIDFSDDDFVLHFYDNDGLSCVFRSYETEYVYFDYNMYEII